MKQDTSESIRASLSHTAVTRCGESQGAVAAVWRHGRDLYDDTRLACYWPSERRAILTHRFYLSLARRREVGLESSIRSWEEGAAVEWRREKMRIDGREQLREIERHKYLLSQDAGRDIGWEAAARDWIEHHARAWREWWETQEGSSPPTY